MTWLAAYVWTSYCPTQLIHNSVGSPSDQEMNHPIRSMSTARQKPSPGGATDKEQSQNTALAAYCKALAQPVRVRILKLLIQKHCVFSDLASQIPLAQSTVSQHLKFLTDAGLVDGEVTGQSTCYCINPDAVDRMKKLINGL
jgi:ArsR family transcriptional regulator, arsenate/arsenite/antimonite-responsive transcriptional repressor